MSVSVAAQSETGPGGPETPALLLQAHALACEKNDKVLFENLDIALAGGEVLLLEGANGSGKTSLIRILCGLAQADAGQVNWCGRDIQTYRAEYLQDLLYVAHANGIKTDLTLLENLEVSEALCGKPNGRSLELVLTQVELGHYADLPAANLSSGQKRRLALSRLLLADARLWILDEPFNSLDENSKRIITGIIIEHVENGGCLVMTSHEQVDWQSLKVTRINL